MRKRDFHDEMVERLKTVCSTKAQVGMALAVLFHICRSVRIEEEHRVGVCEKTGHEIGEYLGINGAHMPAILQALEDAGAIERISVGREKVICLTPKYLAAEVETGRQRGFLVPWFTPPLWSTVKTRRTEIIDAAVNFWHLLRGTTKKTVKNR